MHVRYIVRNRTPQNHPNVTSHTVCTSLGSGGSFQTRWSLNHCDSGKLYVNNKENAMLTTDHPKSGT